MLRTISPEHGDALLNENPTYRDSVNESVALPKQNSRTRPMGNKLGKASRWKRIVAWDAGVSGTPKRRVGEKYFVPLPEETKFDETLYYFPQNIFFTPHLVKGPV